jgi:hypothetical protein
MYAFPLALPGVPVLRPIIESSAKIEIRFLRSAAEISSVVAPRGAGASGALVVVLELPHAAMRGRDKAARILELRMDDRPGVREGEK